MQSSSKQTTKTTMILNVSSVKNMIAAAVAIVQHDLRGLKDGLTNISSANYNLFSKHFEDVDDQVIESFFCFLSLNKAMLIVQDLSRKDMYNCILDNRENIKRAVYILQNNLAALCIMRTKLFFLERQDPSISPYVHKFYENIESYIQYAKSDQPGVPMALKSLQRNYDYMIENEQKILTEYMEPNKCLELFSAYLEDTQHVFLAMQATFGKTVSEAKWKNLSSDEHKQALDNINLIKNNIEVFQAKIKSMGTLVHNFSNMYDPKVEAELLQDESQQKHDHEMPEKQNKKQAKPKKKFQHKPKKTIAIAPQPVAVEPAVVVPLPVEEQIIQDFRKLNISSVQEVLDYVDTITMMQQQRNNQHSKLTDTEKLAYAKCLVLAFSSLRAHMSEAESLNKLQKKVEKLCSEINKDNKINYLLSRLLPAELYKVQTRNTLAYIKAKNFKIVEHGYGRLVIACTADRLNEWLSLLANIDTKIKQISKYISQAIQAASDNLELINEDIYVCQLLIQAEYEQIIEQYHAQLEYFAQQKQLAQLQKEQYKEYRLTLTPKIHQSGPSEATLVQRELAKEKFSDTCISHMRDKCVSIYSQVQMLKKHLVKNTVVNTIEEMPQVEHSKSQIQDIPVNAFAPIKFSRSQSCPTFRHSIQELYPPEDINPEQTTSGRLTRSRSISFVSL